MLNTLELWTSEKSRRSVHNFPGVSCRIQIQVQRAINAQVYEENAIALALLSQQQDENECFEDEDTTQDDGSMYVGNAMVPEEGENDSMECYETICQITDTNQSPPRDVSPEPVQANASTSKFHQDTNDSCATDGNNIHEAIIDNCSNYDGDGVSWNHSQDNSKKDNETSNDFEDGVESDGNSIDSDTELFEDHCTCATLPEQEKIETFSVNQNDFPPEVWRLIKGEAEEKTQEEIQKIKLAQWALKYKIKRNALDELLHLLRDYGHSDLPACAKTLLQTPRSTTNMVKSLASGLFWYYGIVNALSTCLSEDHVQSLQNDTVVIDIFVDGLSPHKKVQRHMWPIAGCLKGEKTPFVIALWVGSCKEPTSLAEFLEEFINESDDLISNGFIHHGREMKLSIRNYLADAPARAWIKQVRPHNSYNSCERCTVEGEWKFRRITYNPSEVATLRTDESFENQCDKAHHLGVSPLLRLRTKMISQIPLDIMHLVYPGVSRRLHALLLQKKAGRFKLPEIDVKKLDSLCLFLYKFCPSEFASKPRPLSQYKLCKATEWRRLLLYDGFLVNKSHKHKEFYECFLLLACAMRILLDSKMRLEFSDDAHKLLVNFVKRSYRVLGSSFVVFNVHHLLHLVADCNLHGDPEDFSCFKFENHLGHLKWFLVAPGRPLQQIICRLMERSLAPVSTPAVAPPQKQFHKLHTFGPTLDCNGKQYTVAYFEGFVIRVARDNPRDAFVLMSSGKVVVIENIVDCNSSTYIIGRQFLNMSNYFGYPMPSSLLNIFKVSSLGPLKKWSKDQISKKVSYFPLVSDGDFNSFNWRYGEGLCIPILHSEV